MATQNGKYQIDYAVSDSSTSNNIIYNIIVTYPMQSEILAIEGYTVDDEVGITFSCRELTGTAFSLNTVHEKISNISNINSSPTTKTLTLTIPVGVSSAVNVDMYEYTTNTVANTLVANRDVPTTFTLNLNNEYQEPTVVDTFVVSDLSIEGGKNLNEVPLNITFTHNYSNEGKSNFNKVIGYNIYCKDTAIGSIIPKFVKYHESGIYNSETDSYSFDYYLPGIALEKKLQENYEKTNTQSDTLLFTIVTIKSGMLNSKEKQYYAKINYIRPISIDDMYIFNSGKAYRVDMTYTALNDSGNKLWDDNGDKFEELKLIWKTSKTPTKQTIKVYTYFGEISAKLNIFRLGRETDILHSNQSESENTYGYSYPTVQNRTIFERNGEIVTPTGEDLGNNTTRYVAFEVIVEDENGVKFSRRSQVIKIQRRPIIRNFYLTDTENGKRIWNYEYGFNSNLYPAVTGGDLENASISWGIDRVTLAEWLGLNLNKENKTFGELLDMYAKNFWKNVLETYERTRNIVSPVWFELQLVIKSDFEFVLGDDYSLDVNYTIPRTTHYETTTDITYTPRYEYLVDTYDKDFLDWLLSLDHEHRVIIDKDKFAFYEKNDARTKELINMIISNLINYNYDTYDFNSTYYKGDRIIGYVSGKPVIYECNADNVSGSWDSSKWVEITGKIYPNGNIYDNIPYNYNTLYSGIESNNSSDKLKSLMRKVVDSCYLTFRLQQFEYIPRISMQKYPVHWECPKCGYKFVVAQSDDSGTMSVYDSYSPSSAYKYNSEQTQNITNIVGKNFNLLRSARKYYACPDCGYTPNDYEINIVPNWMQKLTGVDIGLPILFGKTGDKTNLDLYDYNNRLDKLLTGAFYSGNNFINDTYNNLRTLTASLFSGEFNGDSIGAIMGSKSKTSSTINSSNTSGINNFKELFGATNSYITEFRDFYKATCNNCGHELYLDIFLHKDSHIICPYCMYDNIVSMVEKNYEYYDKDERYFIGNFVEYNNSYYRCVKVNDDGSGIMGIPPTNTEYWTESFVEDGKASIDDVIQMWQGSKSTVDDTDMFNFYHRMGTHDLDIMAHYSPNGDIIINSPNIMGSLTEVTANKFVDGYTLNLNWSYSKKSYGKPVSFCINVGFTDSAVDWSYIYDDKEYIYSVDGYDNTNDVNILYECPCNSSGTYSGTNIVCRYNSDSSYYNISSELTIIVDDIGKISNKKMSIEIIPIYADNSNISMATTVLSGKKRVFRQNDDTNETVKDVDYGIIEQNSTYLSCISVSPLELKIELLNPQPQSTNIYNVTPYIAENDSDVSDGIDLYNGTYHWYGKKNLLFNLQAYNENESNTNVKYWMKKIVMSSTDPSIEYDGVNADTYTTQDYCYQYLVKSVPDIFSDSANYTTGDRVAIGSKYYECNVSSHQLQKVTSVITSGTNQNFALQSTINYVRYYSGISCNSGDIFVNEEDNVDELRISLIDGNITDSTLNTNSVLLKNVSELQSGSTYGENDCFYYDGKLYKIDQYTVGVYKVFVSGNSYNVDDMVIYYGGIYKCLVAGTYTTIDFTSGDWYNTLNYAVCDYTPINMVSGAYARVYVYDIATNTIVSAVYYKSKNVVNPLTTFDTTNFDIVAVDNFVEGNYYKQNDLIFYGSSTSGSVYMCTLPPSQKYTENEVQDTTTTTVKDWWTEITESDLWGNKTEKFQVSIGDTVYIALQLNPNSSRISNLSTIKDLKFTMKYNFSTSGEVGTDSSEDSDTLSLQFYDLKNQNTIVDKTVYADSNVTNGVDYYCPKCGRLYRAKVSNHSVDYYYPTDYIYTTDEAGDNVIVYNKVDMINNDTVRTPTIFNNSEIVTEFDNSYPQNNVCLECGTQIETLNNNDSLSNDIKGTFWTIRALECFNGFYGNHTPTYNNIFRNKEIFYNIYDYILNGVDKSIDIANSHLVSSSNMRYNKPTLPELIDSETEIGYNSNSKILLNYYKSVLGMS